MPTYEYQCQTCGTTFDLFQSIKASPLRRKLCEACGSVRPVRRLVGKGGAIIFRGSGFYQTDYRSESYKKAAKAEGGGSDKTAGDQTPGKDSGKDVDKSTGKGGDKGTDKGSSTGTSSGPDSRAPASGRGGRTSNGAPTSKPSSGRDGD